MEGRDVIPRVASIHDPGSNRFAALADAEIVLASTQESEVRVPETIIDALAEDLERPSRRLVLVGAVHQTPGAGEDTVTTQPAEAPLPTWVDEVEQPFRGGRRRRRFVQRKHAHQIGDASGQRH